MQPVLNGIGGDLFAIVYDPKTHKLYGYNGSGRSAKGRDLARMTAEVEAAYKKAGMEPKAHIPPVGSLPITVPGAVDAWFALHQKFGKLPIAEDLQPPSTTPNHGFPVTQLISVYWKGNMAAFEKNKGLIEESDNARHTYMPAGHTPAEGEIFKNPDLANTLSLIAKGGRDAFYKGPIAKTIDAYFKRVGGDLRYEDFATHHGEWVTPLGVNYRGYDVYELPPNGQGAAVLQMLQILKGYDLKKMGAGSADTLTAMLEAKRLAYEDLARWYADPAFVHVPMKGLLSDGYADERRKLIDLTRANPNIGPGDPKLHDGDTIYLTHRGQRRDDGLAHPVQLSRHGIGTGGGSSGLHVPGSRRALFAEPGSRECLCARETSVPDDHPRFVMKDGQPFLSFGLMGGDMQPQGHVQVLTDIIDFGMNVQEADDAARWRHFGNAEPTGEASQGVGTVEMESGFDPAVKAELAKRGYKIVPGTGGFGGYQAIMRAPNGVYWGASEMRKTAK